ncbi:uncharacterized protein B0I36DRAFT_420844 [Microdochium trichocladiopsis]|uniref:Tyrosinase copper-binding domain-containing protein n=1 Tax=Microdochium trichocladiopsis TaxID=1682393 RepID=A0A9P9BVC7_9PEZI|nr:uncharacterized protein B0I36DRAFT_420844 [Microdochium trichocladiopsis]KAH7038384.1 hypothetical protein B0I36DRAFT_420844 [Microdochium trichocladiopsis]
MHIASITVGLLGVLAAGVSSIPTSPAAGIATRQATCTTDNAIVRKEWTAMTRAERLAYISGIKCLQSLPSRFPAGLIPAAINNYDDFTAVHINQSFSIHISGTFLSWHREMLHILEGELHSKCNYPVQLGIPYWNWLKDPLLDVSPIFSGADDTLGSNGDPDPNPQPIQLTENVSIPHGTGGLCVTKGPFANMEIRFGPFSPLLIPGGVIPANWTASNPRCLTRDFNPYISTTHLNVAFVTLLQASLTIADFQDRLTPTALGVTGLGLHRAGHLALGGPASDFFASPQDPSFFLHHSQVDRMWTIWQDSDITSGRRYAYNGTSTTNSPVGVTPEVNNSTVITFGPLGESISLGEAADPMAGRYCYRYE